MFRKRSVPRPGFKRENYAANSRHLSSFEKLLGFSTLAVALATLITSAYQVYLESGSLDISKRDHLPNIIANNEYLPKESYDRDTQQIFLPPNNNIRLYGDLSFVENIFVQNVSYISTKITDLESDQKTTVNLAFDGYFDFCNVNIQPSSNEFGSCIGNNNAFEQDRLPGIANTSNKISEDAVVYSSNFYTIFKITYKTLLGEEKSEFIRINNFGIYKGGELSSDFDSVYTSYMRGIHVGAKTSGEDFLSILLKEYSSLRIAK